METQYSADVRQSYGGFLHLLKDVWIEVGFKFKNGCLDVDINKSNTHLWLSGLVDIDEQ